MKCYKSLLKSEFWRLINNFTNSNRSKLDSRAKTNKMKAVESRKLQNFRELHILYTLHSVLFLGLKAVGALIRCCRSSSPWTDSPFGWRNRLGDNLPARGPSHIWWSRLRLARQASFVERLHVDFVQLTP